MGKKTDARAESTAASQNESAARASSNSILAADHVVIRTLTTENVKFIYDPERQGYVVKSIGVANRNLLRYVRLSNGALLKNLSVDALVELTTRIEEKAALQAKLFE